MRLSVRSHLYRRSKALLGRRTLGRGVGRERRPAACFGHGVGYAGVVCRIDVVRVRAPRAGDRG